ncbi:uncharacterized protein [Musca autumnalis]|uniref:uncharacterized protein n=1 Tax=Musca autumnalis TaxID=221902 RepID=UPI003CE7A896
MSCICEYFIHSKDADQDTNNSKSSINKSSNNKQAPSVVSQSSSVTDIATAQAEIWLLKKSISENRISIENLENLVKTMMERQNIMLSEMYRLKRINFELREECRIQRDYHSMERNAMLRELHDVRELLSNRSKILEETVLKNAELLNSVQDANEKIYLMGIKYLKIKNCNLKPICNGSFYESSEDDDESEEVTSASEESD